MLEVRVPACFKVLVKIFLQVADYQLLAASSHGGRGEGALWGSGVSFIRAPIPFMRVLPS